MKNILLSILLLGCAVQAQAQERFFKLLDGWKAEKVFETDSSYVVVGLNSYQSHNYYQFSSLTKIGDSLDAWSFDIDTFSQFNIYGANDISKQGENYLIAGAGYISNNTSGTLLKFAPNLRDTLQGKKLFYEDGTILRCPIYRNNNIWCLAQCYKINGDIYIKALQLDTTFNVLNSRDFYPALNGGVGGKLRAQQLLPTLDGGYLYVLSEQYFSSNGDSKRPVLIKTDSLGVQQWRRYVGDANYLCEGGYAVAAPDGGWLVAWGAPMTYAMVSQSNMQDGVRIEKIRANGSTEWVTNLGNYFEQVSRRATYYPKQFQALADGNYLVSGKTQGHGFLVKVDSNGNPLWYRLILDPLAAQNNVFYAGAMIYSTTPTSDGGFICAGEYQSDPGGLFPNLVQSAFAMKLDEYGCLEPGCQVADAVEDLYISSGGIKVYPNPAQQFTVFEYRLQENAHNPSISIWTTTGTLVSQHLLGSTEGIWTWDTQQIPDGLYFYTLSDTNGVISTGKIAVQH